MYFFFLYCIKWPSYYFILGVYRKKKKTLTGNLTSACEPNIITSNNGNNKEQRDLHLYFCYFSTSRTWIPIRCNLIFHLASFDTLLFLLCTTSIICFYIVSAKKFLFFILFIFPRVCVKMMFLYFLLHFYCNTKYNKQI